MEMFWENKGWEKEDPHLNRLDTLPFRRAFPFIPSEQGLYMIRGPRQIGKSSWLKTILSHYAGENASWCFYYSCENLRDHLDLEQLLKSVKDKRIILLDEITFVAEWARAVKHYIDQGKHHIVVLTGSDSHDLRKGMDRMPGRFGKGGEFTLLPMDFSEFSQMRKKASWGRLSREEELSLYFRIGGFPSALAEAGSEGKIPMGSMETYKKWLVGDFTRRGKQEIYLREVLSQLALTMGSSISLQKLASKTQIGSHHTVQEYINLLEDCFALRTLYAVDPNTGAFQFKKEKKFYFTDPLIFWLSLYWISGIETKEYGPQLAEMCACEHLSRKFGRFGYYNSRSGEVDFYSRNEWAIEIKWADFVHNVSETFKDLKVPKKTVWFKGNFFEEL